MDNIRVFRISVPDSEIQKLRQKLDLASFPSELDEAGWDYGAPLADVKRIATYWRNEFDWRKIEATLNTLPNYKTLIDVDGFESVETHFLHRKSENPKAIPLIFIHGWPGSFIEVTKLLPLLEESERNGGPAFHVVAPSLPNFGFSAKVTRKGFGQRQYAETCHKLMLALGYDQYVSQGGDWGAFITHVMAYLYPQHLKAAHLNMIVAHPPGPTSPIALLTLIAKYSLGLFSASEKTGLERSQWYQKCSSGYLSLQTTKPQTLGYSLADSPVGLLAWIYEKLHDWTDGYEWTDEEICAWISVYVFSTAGPAASTTIYYESAGEGKEFDIMKPRPYVNGTKLGLSYFPKDVVVLPKSWASKLGTIVFSKEHQRGGHFAAYEVPELLFGDLKVMFGKGGGAYGVVDGRNGYS
ncbi:alpha/beta-hydrolase [Amniculicola lignicola CBS 123094]|uniref:Alpha/beta-hydrolase n=1 Tax=Amniculicola lignicola CBS 123094 TaxID=1392246 RepID=A0A6A5VVU4_9PLEO|nr:alpha/beta-hydrolase [Amniculicola lignicola CBS 123094]